jgi:hypothetical protein
MFNQVAKGDIWRYWETKADHHPFTQNRRERGQASRGYFYLKYDVMDSDYAEFEPLSFHNAWCLIHPKKEFRLYMATRKRREKKTTVGKRLNKSAL